MAGGKKSFVMYADWNVVVKKLSDEEAGRLIKHLLAYVNDEDPAPPDRLIELLFEPIKLQLKRDLRSWEEEIGKKIISGQLGNMKRWHPEIYQKVMSKELTFEEGMSICFSHQSHSEEKDRTAKETVASVADNDNVNVNVNVNDNVNVINDHQLIIDDLSKSKKGKKPKEVKERNIVMPWDSEQFSKVWNDWKEYKTEQHRFKYKSTKSEQAALNQLAEISSGVESLAIKLVHNAMSKGWQGIYFDKNIANGHSENRRNQQGYDPSTLSKFHEFISGTKK